VLVANAELAVAAAQADYNNKKALVDGDTPVIGPDGSMHGDWHTETEEAALRAKGGIL
jgi:hypothetical protein